MCRKIGIVAVLAAVGLFVLSFTGLSSYSGTAFSKIKQSLKKEVPLEFEIERLRYEVTELVPDMKKHLSTIAEDMVAVDTLKEEVTDLRANLGKQKASILSMTKDVESGNQFITYGDREYSADRIRRKLANDFASFQRCEKELQSKEQLLEAKEKALDSNRERLASMRAQKEEFEVQLAELEAEVKSMRLAQTKSKFELDDSKLAQCKATLAEIKNRLKVEKKTTELSGEFANDASIPVEKKAKSAHELTREVRGYFAPKSEAKVAEKK